MLTPARRIDVLGQIALRCPEDDEESLPIKDRIITISEHDEISRGHICPYCLKRYVSFKNIPKMEHIIDYALLSADDFNTCFIKRVKVLLSLIEKTMGKSVSDRGPYATNEQFGASLE